MKQLGPSLVLLCLLVVGCSIERTQLVGHYRAEYSFGFDEIDLRSNGTFTQTAEAVVEGVKRRATVSGTWTIEAAEGTFGERLSLRPLLWVENGVGKLHPKFGSVGEGGGIMAFGREWGVGRIYLGGGNGYPHRWVDK